MNLHKCIPNAQEHNHDNTVPEASPEAVDGCRIVLQFYFSQLIA